MDTRDSQDLPERANFPNSLQNSGSNFRSRADGDRSSYKQDKVFFHSNSNQGIAQRRHYSIEAPNRVDTFAKLNTHQSPAIKKPYGLVDESALKKEKDFYHQEKLLLEQDAHLLEE